VNGPNSLQVRPAQRLTAPDGTEADIDIDIVPFVQAPSLSRLLNLCITGPAASPTSGML
jgi:hypothetical protein